MSESNQHVDRPAEYFHSASFDCTKEHLLNELATSLKKNATTSEVDANA